MSEEEQTVRSSGTPEAAAVANVRTLQDVQRDIQKENVEFFYQARKEYRGAVSAYDAAWTASKSDPTNKVLSEDLAHAKEFRDIYKRLLDISEAHLEELEAERAQLQAAANRASEQKSLTDAHNAPRGQVRDHGAIPAGGPGGSSSTQTGSNANARGGVQQVNPIANFVALLKQAHVKPSNDALIWIGKQEAALNFVSAITDVDLALGYYRAIENIPQTATKNIISSELGLNIGCPISSEFPQILSAFDNATLESRAVKIIKRKLSVEADMIGELELKSPTHAFVQTTSHELSTAKSDFHLTKLHERTYTILSMERCIHTLEHGLFEDDILCKGFDACKSALAFMHSKNWIHMDVKTSNIFFSAARAKQTGQGFCLGDFGSVVRHYAAITSTTSQYYPENREIRTLDEKDAKYAIRAFPCVDLYMLCVAFVRSATIRLYGPIDCKRAFGHGARIDDSVFQKYVRESTDFTSVFPNLRQLVIATLDETVVLLKEASDWASKQARHPIHPPFELPAHLREHPISFF